MGMDVFGKNPQAPEGEYFRATVWFWHPLADYVCSIAPEQCRKCMDWHTNDGDGLDESDSIQLAEKLQAELDAGRTESYARLYNSKQTMMPKEPCEICEGTGTRRPVPNSGAGNPKNGGTRCNGCDGAGFREPWDCNYPFSVEVVQEFTAFLQTSGGFSIC
jgi:hypothetical protein